MYNDILLRSCLKVSVGVNTVQLTDGESDSNACVGLNTENATVGLR